MADTYNVVRQDGVFFEGMTKEQVYAAIAEATGMTPQDIDSAFISKLKEINKNTTIQVWMGTNAEYNALQMKADGVLYVITDDTFVDDTGDSIEEINTKLEANTETLNEHEERLDELPRYIEYGKATSSASNTWAVPEVPPGTMIHIKNEVGAAYPLTFYYNCEVIYVQYINGDTVVDFHSVKEGDNLLYVTRNMTHGMLIIFKHTELMIGVQ